MVKTALLIVAAGLAVLIVLNRDEATAIATALLNPIDNSRCESAGPFSRPVWERSATDTGASAAKSAEPRRLPLGEGSLLLGIPGEGPVSVAELDAWLADKENHRPIEPQLPVGLERGAMDLAGLEGNPLTAAKIELGRQLFFDTRLSVDGTISCASCHDPAHGYASADRVSAGVGNQPGARNTPTAANRLLAKAQFWDGRAASLEEQAIGPMANPREMGMSHQAVVELLRESSGYVLQFDRIFGDGVTIENAGRAIACFERALVTGASPWDHYSRLREFETANAEDLAFLADAEAEELDEEDAALAQHHASLQRAAGASPISPQAIRGAELFFSDRAGCAQCHAGANFTDELYHNLGVGLEGATSPGAPGIDWGRFAVTGDDPDRGAFKTPTLRNVAQTAPYLHDGSLGTLAEVVEFYVEGGQANPWLSDKITPLDLDTKEQQDLVAFLESLTGEWPAVERQRLPE